MPYRKIVAEIIATEISSLQQTFNTYKKCIQLIAEVEKTKLAQKKNITFFLEALKKHLEIYEKIYIVVGEPIENFFADLNIPSSNQIKEETNLNKVAQALANLICSEQFFNLCKLRETATLEYPEFNQTFSSLIEELSKKSFDTNTYTHGQESINNTMAAVMQRFMKYELFARDLEKTDLSKLAILLKNIGSTHSLLTNEKNRITGKNGDFSEKDIAQRRAQIVAALEQVTQQLNQLQQLLSKKALTEEEQTALQELRKLQTMESHIKTTLRYLDETIAKTTSKAMTEAKNAMTILNTAKKEAEKLLTSIYETLKQPAPPFKRELPTHQPYVYIVAPEKIADIPETPSVDKPKRERSKSKLQRAFTTISRKFSLGSTEKLKKRESIEASSSSDEISLATPRASSSIAILTTTTSSALTASCSAPTSPTSSRVRLRVEALNRGEIASSSNASSSAEQEQPQATLSPRSMVAEKIAEFEQRIAEQQEALLKDSQQLLKNAVALNKRLAVAPQATPTATTPVAAKKVATPTQPKFGLSGDVKKRSQSLGSLQGNNKINGTVASSSSTSSSRTTQFKP